MTSSHSWILTAVLSTMRKERRRNSQSDRSMTAENDIYY